jgi:hypothetical protein
VLAFASPSPALTPWPPSCARTCRLGFSGLSCSTTECFYLSWSHRSCPKLDQ